MASRTSKKSSSKKSAAQKSGSKKSAARKSAAKRPASGTAARRGDRLAALAPLAAVSGSRVDRFVQAKESWSDQLLRPRAAATFAARTAAASPTPEHNVVGVGVGEKLVGGRHTGVMAIKFLVRVKYDDRQITSSDRLPEEVNGLPTDVEEVGTFRRFEAVQPLAATPDPRTLLRPAPPGCSVGFEDPSGNSVMAGTFGALARRGPRLFVLSNNHVLADENRLPAGSSTFQPGLLDAGSPPVTGEIAKLSAFVDLHPSDFNLVDAAISEVSDPSLVTNAIIKIGAPTGVAAAQDKMSVHKFGRTTGYRVGFIDTTMMDVSVEYEIGVLNFRNQIIIKGLGGQQFSASGDSGSAIIERNTGRAVGLLFAGSSSHTIANHMDDVLQALNITLA